MNERIDNRPHHLFLFNDFCFQNYYISENITELLVWSRV